MNKLKEQVHSLGIRPGVSLFVHSSVKAVGHDVRPEEVIALLREAVGDEGTLLFPTFTARDKEYFDPGTAPSVMGAASEVFRTMPGTLRSRHPRHPVAAQGPAAVELLEGHEHAIGPCGSGTPFEKHARSGGQILMIGVDLDTLTLLHTAEALLDLPYLFVLDGAYLDSGGSVKRITMHQAPGGHRGGVRLFEKAMRNLGLIRYGWFGNARTLLMDAGRVLDYMIERLRNDPMAALCRGDYCPDCTYLKSKIRSRQLIELGAELSILLPAMPDDPAKYKELVDRFASHINFVTAADLNIIHVSAGEKVPPPPDHIHTWILQPDPTDLIRFEALPTGYAGFAYNPVEASQAGLHPFYDVVYKAKCRDLITDIFIEDGFSGLKGFCFPPLKYCNELAPDGNVVLGEGHAQLREIISALRMRNYSGRYHLVVPPGNLYVDTLKLLKEFWNLLP